MSISTISVHLWLKLLLMPQYSTLRIEKNIADEFRLFSTEFGRNQTDSLRLMISFFEKNQLTPHDNVKESIVSVQKNLYKRIDSFIAIIRNMEKNYIIPTYNISKLLQDIKEYSVSEQENIPSKNTEEFELFRKKADDISNEILVFLSNLERDKKVPDQSVLISIKRKISELCM